MGKHAFIAFMSKLDMAEEEKEKISEFKTSKN